MVVKVLLNCVSCTSHQVSTSPDKKSLPTRKSPIRSTTTTTATTTTTTTTRHTRLHKSNEAELNTSGDTLDDDDDDDDDDNDRMTSLSSTKSTLFQLASGRSSESMTLSNISARRPSNVPGKAQR
jgi:hypothetical protein